MKRTLFFVGLGWCLSSAAVADPKDDLIRAAVDQCKLSQEKAEPLATGGRTGTIMQFTLCINPTVELGEGCKVSCKKQGSNIGG